MNNIYLIGFMGTGKSTVAKKLQRFLPFQVVEMDEAVINNSQGKQSNHFLWWWNSSSAGECRYNEK